MEESNVRVGITLPTMLFLENDGNANVTVTGITGNAFTIQNLANGNATLSGAVNNLEIRKTGNGNVNAKALMAENVTVKSSGNGSVHINTNNNFSVKASGNGSITNNGNGQPDATSAINGNARFIAMDTKKAIDTTSVKKADDKKRVYFVNKSNEPISIKIAWPVSGKYGNTIPPNKTVTEMLPLGTTIKSKALKSGIAVTHNNQEIIFE